MSLIEDAKRLEKSGFTPWEDSCHLTCELCGEDGAGEEGPFPHAPTCPWLALPRIVAALEAAGWVVNSNVQVVRTWHDEYNGWKMSCGSCLRTIPKGGLLTSEFPHKPDCPWQALVAAMRA